MVRRTRRVGRRSAHEVGSTSRHRSRPGRQVSTTHSRPRRRRARCRPQRHVRAPLRDRGGRHRAGPPFPRAGEGRRRRRRCPGRRPNEARRPHRDTEAGGESSPYRRHRPTYSAAPQTVSGVRRHRAAIAVHRPIGIRGAPPASSEPTSTGHGPRRRSGVSTSADASRVGDARPVKPSATTGADVQPSMPHDRHASRRQPVTSRRRVGDSTVSPNRPVRRCDRSWSTRSSRTPLDAALCRRPPPLPTPMAARARSARFDLPRERWRRRGGGRGCRRAGRRRGRGRGGAVDVGAAAAPGDRSSVLARGRGVDDRPSSIAKSQACDDTDQQDDDADQNEFSQSHHDSFALRALLRCSARPPWLQRPRGSSHSRHQTDAEFRVLVTFERALADMIMPGVQNPHCTAQVARASGPPSPPRSW